MLYYIITFDMKKNFTILKRSRDLKKKRYFLVLWLMNNKKVLKMIVVKKAFYDFFLSESNKIILNLNNIKKFLANNILYTNSYIVEVMYCLKKSANILLL